MLWWAEVSADGTRSSGTVIFAMRARHSARRPHRTGASACRTRAGTLLRQPDIVGDKELGGPAFRSRSATATGPLPVRKYPPVCAVAGSGERSPGTVLIRVFWQALRPVT